MCVRTLSCTFLRCRALSCGAVSCRAVSCASASHECVRCAAQVDALLKLDDARRIFSRPWFGAEMAPAFAELFVLVLVSRTHGLLRDEIVQVSVGSVGTPSVIALPLQSRHRPFVGTDCARQTRTGPGP